MKLLKKYGGFLIPLFLGLFPFHWIIEVPKSFFIFSEEWGRILYISGGWLATIRPISLQKQVSTVWMFLNS